jgi:hypothetical protein
MNSKTGAVIDNDSFPVIGDEAQLLWKDPSQFLAGISCLSTTVLGVLETIQPGFSTLSTNFTRVRNFMLMSTVAGIGQNYCSTNQVTDKLTQLSIEHGYISSTALYDCVGGLSRLVYITQSIGPMVMFLQATGRNFADYGYVSTINAGNYHNYYSTLGFTGGLNNANINSVIQSLSLDLGGFQILGSSKMRLDINANLSVDYTTPPESINTNFSTFLHNGTRPIGTPVVVNYSNLNFSMIAKFRAFL